MAITSSSRLGITRWSADTDTVSRAQFDGDHGKLDDLAALDMQGTLANRPAAAASNRGLYYFVTGDATAANNDRLYRSTGAAWVEILTGPAANAASLSRVILAAPALVVSMNAPTLGTLNIAPAWLLDAGLQERIAGETVVPNGWATFDLVVWWGNTSTGAGDVTFSAHHQSIGDGEAINVTGPPSVTATAAAQYVAKKTTIATGLAVTPGDVQFVAVTRLGNVAADTLAADIGVLALELVKAS